MMTLTVSTETIRIPMISRATETTARLFWQVGQCPSWCEVAFPHRESGLADDRVHVTLSGRSA